MGNSRGRFRACAKSMQNKEVGEIEELFDAFVDFKPQECKAIRTRLFDPMRVFWMFLGQIFAGNVSCCKTVQKALAWLAFQTAEMASPNTAAYCKARQRLPIQWLEDTHVKLADAMEEATSPEDLWHNRSVKIVDGSGLSMPDTEENQKRWPQSRSQKKGCGFPTMRIVALFSMSTGALLRLVEGTLRVSERILFHELWQWLYPGDIVLADCGFASFADFYLLSQRGVDSVMRNHQRRTVGVRHVKRLGRKDCLVAWKRTGQCPKWLQKEVWDNMPKEMIVRQIDLRVEIPGFRTEKIVVVTTLLDPKLYRAKDFTDLYRKRWLVELFLRDIKISMGMDTLKCKTPEMVLKEVLMYLIAYNLIRSVIYRAAVEHGVGIMRISFKQTADTLLEWMPLLAMGRIFENKTCKLLEIMLLYISMGTVPWRPDRTEPRAIKRRMKNYQLLNELRSLMKESPHRSKYTKA